MSLIHSGKIKPMSGYTDRVRDNIIPLSQASTLREAFKEWYFTDSHRDHENAVAECQLCKQERLRYQFEIRSSKTQHRLWVGSSCILRFGVLVYDQGQVLDSQQAEKKLTTLMNQMRQESCLNALKALAEKEKNDILSNALSFYEANGYLTPKFAFVVFWRLSVHHIDHCPSFFKINLKIKRYREQLSDMPESRVHQFWQALTSGQKRVAERYGHKAPKV